MASQYLINTIQDYENYILRNGIDEQVVEAYVLASATALNEEKDIEYGLKVSARAKEVIESLVRTLTGGSIWDLEKYCKKNADGI